MPGFMRPKQSLGRTIMSVTTEAVVTRADGRVENLGVVSFNHQNPLRRWAWRISQWVRGRRAGTATAGVSQ